MAVQYQASEPFQHLVLQCGKRLLSTCNTSGEQHKWLDQLIGRTIIDPQFRVQALRFIDVLPSLDDDQMLAQHLQEYFSDLELPRFAQWGLNHSDTPWVTQIAAPTVRYTLRGLARRFMGGSQLHHALTTISRLRHKNMNFTLDLLGEATISETECDNYFQQYMDMLKSLPEPIANWHHNDLLDISHGQATPRLNLSLKLSSLYSQIRTTAPEASIEAICQRLRPLLKMAREKQAFITIDMEQYDFKHIVLQCFRNIIMEPEFKDWPHIGLAMQAYLKDTYDDIQNLIELIKQRKTPATVRLVRGAYWDYETVIAKQHNWPCPVWQHKNDTDYNYEQCLQLLLSNSPHIHTAIATHNPRSLAFAMALIDELGLADDAYEFQMLFGMADDLKYALVKLNYRLRTYVPYGETLPGMSYLVRRLLENSSGQGLLDSGFTGQSSNLDEKAFTAPSPTQKTVQLKSISTPVFKNIALLRFTEKQERFEFAQAINHVEKNLGEYFKLIIDGKEYETDNTIESFNPAQPDQLIGSVACAEHKHADQALQAAKQAFTNWKSVATQQRADYLRRVASLLKQRRMEFSALQVLEAGKNWQEADADICEAIDFLNFYAMQAENIQHGDGIHVSGENNQIKYTPRGVSLIIPPWNFPLAILCGMLSAAVVTGNTCILKPSSLTPIIAAKFMQLWREVDLPNGVINFLPGPGKVVGEYLARKPDIHIIAFTGSQQVGTQLIKTGADIQPGQHHIKTVIAEMGGKNALIVDSDADLDDAVLGALHSAFGFQGQKCSAASRIITVGNIHQRFVSRLVEAVKSIKAGNPKDPQFFMGPVIDAHSHKRILQSIYQGKQIATVHHNFDDSETSQGFYIHPTIFTDVDHESPLAQEEIFGPVLSLFNAATFEQAITLANDTRYALTGGIYSRQPSHLEYAREHFHVGNLYLNRKITGALVNRQPFGGFAMSGTGNKAGGKNYLMQFMDSICVTENTLRRGFAPEEDER